MGSTKARIVWHSFVAGFVLLVIRGVDAEAVAQPGLPEVSLNQAEAARLGVDKLFGSTRLREFRLQPGFTPDGKYLVGNGPWKFKFLNIETGETHEVPMRSRVNGIGRFLLSPDGEKMLIDTTSGSVSVWDISTGNANFLTETDLELKVVQGLAWSPDSKFVLTGHHKVASVRNAETGEIVASMEFDGNQWINCAAWSPDGSIYACGAGRHNIEVRVFDASTHKEIKRLSSDAGLPEEITGFRFVDSQQLVVCAPKTVTEQDVERTIAEVKIWNARTGEFIKEIERANAMGAPSSFCLTPDRSQVVVQSHDNVRFFDLATGELSRELTQLPVGAMVGEIAISPDATKIAYGGELVKLIEIESRDWLHASAADGHDGRAIFSRSPDGSRLISSANDGQLITWDWETCRPIRTLTFDPALEPGGRAWSKDGKLFYQLCKVEVFHASDEEPRAEILAIDAASGEQAFRVAVNLAPDSEAFRFGLSPQGDQLAVLVISQNRALGSDPISYVDFFDAHNGRKLRSVQFPNLATSRVQYFHYSPDGKFLLTTYFNSNEAFQVWDVETGEKVYGEAGWEAGLVNFSTDGGRLVGRNKDRELVVYDTMKRREILKINVPNMIIAQHPMIFGDGKHVGARCFEAEVIDGKPQVVNNDRQDFRIWNVETGALEFVINNRTFSNGGWYATDDGQYIMSTFTGNAHGAIAAWKLENIVERPERDQD